MSYSKTYSRINWENEPSVATPINETNLNRMDYSLDAVDTECQTLDTTKANQSDLLLCVKEITYDSTTGQFVFTWQNGSTFTVDLNIEKIPVSFSMDANGVITMTTEDGTTYTADVGSLIKTYSFVDSSQIDFTVTVDAQTGNKSVTAEIKDGSITESKLQPNFLADCKTEVTKAQNAASAAEQSEEDSEAWAVGERGGVPVGPGDPTYHNNSKYWSQQANPTSLVGLTDTNINNPQPNQVLGVDPNDTTKWINMDAPTAGLLPHLYIDSEAGSTVTVIAPDSSVITPTAAGAGHWECDVPSYGVYTIHSVLAGQGDAVISVTIDDVKEYHITDNHFDYTINVTAPSGSTIRITGGGETYTGTGTGTSQAFAVHQPSTVYTVQVTMDGNPQSQTVTSAATTGQSTSVSIEFGTITVTVDSDFISAGSTITCTKGGMSCTPKPAASTVTFRVPETGTWAIASEISGQPYTKDAVVSSLATPVAISLETIPDGSTVTPTDDIQIWLNCAGIFDKTSYTTLDDVLADHDTLAKLISDHNAMDYLVRCKTWISSVDGLVPEMTGQSTPSGHIEVSSVYAGSPAWDVPYKVFNKDWDKSPLYVAGGGWGSAANASNSWMSYEFPTAQKVRAVKIRTAAEASTTSGGVPTATYGSNGYRKYGVTSFKVQYSDTGNSADWTDVDDGAVFNIGANDDIPLTFSFGDNGSHKYWRVLITSSSSTTQGIMNLQFYSASITCDETFMRYVGKRNYATNLLLSDADWTNSICTSPYVENVLNKKVPTMTANNAPEGEAFSSGTYSGTSAYDAWYAFAGYRGQTAHSSGRWCGTSGSQTGYLGYEFTEPVAVNKIVMLNQGENPQSNNPKDYTGKIEYYDGTQWQPACSFSSVKEAAGDNRTIIFDNTVKSTKWRVYFNSAVISYSGGDFNEVSELQFYGRVDVSETNIDIYSAANDTVTITPQGGGTAITCVTDANGVGSLSRASLPAGTYTFASSVAKDPNNLSNDYSKSNVVVTANMMEVFVMPDNVLYWYGYVGSNLEDFTTANGWTPWTSYSLNTPTHNTNNIRCYSNSTYYVQGVASKIALSGKIKSIYKGITANDGDYGYIHAYSSKTLTSATDLLSTRLSSSGVNYLETTAISNGYIVYYAANSREFELHALWVD